MTDRVLPSREEVADRPDSNTHPDWDMWWEQVGNPTLDARASGRLVDREAINYELIAAAVSMTVESVRLIVDAALEEAREMAYDEYLKGTVL